MRRVFLLCMENHCSTVKDMAQNLMKDFFLVRTSSLGSFTLELCVNQIFRDKNPMEMLWSLAKLSQKRVFSPILHHSKFISDFIQNSTNTEKIAFSDPTLPHPKTFHLGFYLKIFDSVILFKSRVSKFPN